MLLLSLSGCSPQQSDAREVPRIRFDKPVSVQALAREIDATIQAGKPSGATDVAWRRARQLYENNGNTAHWIDSTGLLPRIERYVGEMRGVIAHGLRPDDYLDVEISQLLNEMRDQRTPDLQQLARLEVLLTTSMAMYADHMLTGRIDPRTVEPNWHISPKTVDVDSAVWRTLSADDFNAALAQLLPTEAGYSTLMKALARYRDYVKQGGWTQLNFSQPLKMGDSSADVVALRDRLAREGYLPQAESSSARYDAALAATIARFQTRHGLSVDSAVGPRTLQALNVPAQARLEQIVINLERYRWLPLELGSRRIIVNIPAFRLEAYDNGKEVLTMPVVVGRELVSRRTPVFADSMSYLEFGPYWNVPAPIALEEVLPAAYSDDSYLSRNNYEVVDKAGNVVGMGAVSSEAIESGEYRIRQKPGAGNALGRVKFMFPNDFDVYLHDTPAQALFNEEARAYSHGCVRVADPEALANYVLANQKDWTPERISSALQGSQSLRVDLQQKIPVYLIYLTAFELDGELAFRDDLYDMDNRMRSHFLSRTSIASITKTSRK